MDSTERESIMASLQATVDSANAEMDRIRAEVAKEAIAANGTTTDYTMSARDLQPGKGTNPFVWVSSHVRWDQISVDEVDISHTSPIRVQGRLRKTGEHTVEWFNADDRIVVTRPLTSQEA
jgi:hypothetical protein